MANRPDPAENELIQFYFFKGFEYNEILLFMSKYHGIEMSLRTLKRRLRSFALKRRNAVIDHQECRRAVTELVNGPGNLRGYRAIWHSLQLQGMRVPRGIVQQLVHEIDPEGTDVRRSRRLRRIGSLLNRGTWVSSLLIAFTCGKAFTSRVAICMVAHKGQTKHSLYWTKHSLHWTKHSLHWTKLSLYWTKLSLHWTKHSLHWTKLSFHWTKLSLYWRNLFLKL